MPEMTCTNCGVPLLGITDMRFCSDECRESHDPDRKPPCSACGNSYQSHVDNGMDCPISEEEVERLKQKLNGERA